MKRLAIALCLVSLHAMAAPVNINQADAETISKSLNGIGPKKAEAIVKYRNEHGRFETLQDLEKVSGIGEKTLKANEKDILLSDGAGDGNVAVPDNKAASVKVK